jgi:hypothetical protein
MYSHRVTVKDAFAASYQQFKAEPKGLFIQEFHREHAPGH